MSPNAVTSWVCNALQITPESYRFCRDAIPGYVFRFKGLPRRALGIYAQLLVNLEH